MSEFETLGGGLDEARRRQEAARTALFRATEARKRLEAAALRLDRHFDEERQQDRAQAQAIERRANEIAAAIDAHQAALDRESRVVAELSEVFVPLTDPHRQIREKSSDVPFLLFPLRLETRFKTMPGPAGDEIDEMWVRVYPDDCLVDTFEDTPSEQELLATEQFWVDWVAAGGDDDLRRGAWKRFASTSGHGRAAWLLGQYRPAASAEFPTRTDPSDVFLVVAVQPPVPGSEKPALIAFWSATWRAADDPGAQQAAFAALEASVGTDRAATLRDSTAPRNVATAPPPGADRADVRVDVAFLELPDLTTTDAQRLTWSHAPQVRVFPERLVLRGYRADELMFELLGNVIPTPLVVGPDPLAAPEEQMRAADGEVVVGEAMRWMVDFDEAIRVGMGFRVSLSAADVAAGFDELVAVGVRLAGDESTGKLHLEELFQHHQSGTTGFSLLPQGTPTNNTEDGGSGFSETEEPDESFDLILGNISPLVRETTWLPRSDGQWLAEMLGIDLATFDRTLHARGRDQCEARAINTALWPGTWGYFMETLMDPVFPALTIEQARWFFTNFVVARGTMPAIRIGDQPYGVLPTTVFSRMTWLGDDRLRLPEVPVPPIGIPQFLVGLERVLSTMNQDWQALAAGVSRVGGPGDPHQVLLDVVGLHGASVEFHQRYAESLEQLSNRLNLEGFLGELIAALIALGHIDSGMNLLSRLGYAGDDVPELLEKFFLGGAFKLLGPVIDDQPLSETAPIRPYTDDGRNYLTWLADSARSSFDAIRRQEGFTDGKRPTALLYLLLRYALEQGYWDASLRLFEAAEVLSDVQLQAARLDPSFVHVAEPGTAAGPTTAPANLRTSGKPVRLEQRSESRYEFLYRSEAAITGSPDLLVSDFIGQNLGTVTGTRHLYQQLRAMDHLASAPTARLERVLAEHLDLCTYRLDAWRAGLLNYQLAALRYGGAEAESVRGGVHLGAFGWLTDVRSEEKALTPVELSDELDAVFNPPDQPAQPPLVRDSTNGGFIHAPSLNHATTAAILRNGYLANAGPDNPDTLKVNLSSERVRTALGVIEGIRAGQKLGALLGYQLERGLHDRHEVAEVDKFIYDLRKAFPLVADRLTDTTSDDTDPIEVIEARNVVDGYALVTHVNATGVTTYPFGKPLPPATAAEAAVINAEVDRIRDLYDAVADLAVAEGVHETVLGNVDRVASTLDAYSHGNFPPEPSVAETPRSGIHLTHRMGLHLEAGLDPSVSPNALAVTPRAHAEPALNAWISGLLPNPAAVFCTAEYVDAADGLTKTVDVSQADLGLQPLDLVYLVNPQTDQAMAGLDDLVVQHVLSTLSPRWDTGVSIGHTVRQAGRFSFFEVGALVRPLRSLLLTSRPLNAADVAMPNETSTDQEERVFVDETRITEPLTRLDEIVASGSAGDDLSTLSADIDAWVSDSVAHRDDILAATDGWVDRAMALLAAASFFAVPGAGTGFAYEWKGRQFGRLVELVVAVVERWEGRLAEYDDIIDVQLPAAPTAEEGFTLLRRAEAKIATVATVPLPANPAAYLTVLQPLRQAFVDKLDELRALTDPGDPSLAGVLQRIAAVGPLDAFESTGLDTREVEDEVLRFAAELRDRLDQIAAGIGDRTTTTQGLLTAAEVAGSSKAAVNAYIEAAKALFGDDFRLVPELEPTEDQGSEWAKGHADRDVLLTYLTDAEPTGQARDHPVDDWLHGVARVRDSARAWEQVTMLTGAFGTTEPSLTPIQLPYHADDRWLGLEHPPDYAFDGERLLYTAHYASPFTATERQCGLLLDEWTEVIPNAEETTGITFHYDRPSSEPPQAMLLVTSPQLSEPWQWEDLVDAVRETFDEAKLRVVEPTQVDGTDYARFLPATISAVTLHPITIMLNLALNNQVQTLLEADGG